MKSKIKISNPSSVFCRLFSIVHFVALVLFLCVCPAYALVEFKDGLTHDIDYEINDNVYVDYQTPDRYTTVNWLDGASISSLYYFRGDGHSKINIRGGSMTTNIGIYESSQVDISGGSMGSLVSYNSSQVNISGGSIGVFLAWESSQADISGGSIGVFESWGSSEVDISDGSIEGFGSCNSSQVGISGGSIYGDLDTYNFSQVDINGGKIGRDLHLYGQSQIKIFGSDFAVDGQPFGYGELTNISGHLTGTLLSGDLIDNDFYIGYNAKIVLIPEPATLLLLGFGSLVSALRRRRR